MERSQHRPESGQEDTRSWERQHGLRAALERLEARRLQLERQIVADLEEKFFTAPSPGIRSVVASHDGSRVTGANIDTSDTETGNGSHVTVTWFDND